MLGDTGVAINPLDPRAARLHPRNVKLPLTDREIPIVLDEMADLAFGSGAVKITPAHDPNDFEAGKRHDLPSIQVIGEDAKMTAAAGKFAGLDRYEARKRIVAELQELGYLVKIEPYKLNVGKCHRCKTVVEPLVSKAMVDEDEAAGRARHRRGRRRPHHLRARQLVEDLFRVDVQHPRLVHFAPALVGPSHSRVVLRRL